MKNITPFAINKAFSVNAAELAEVLFSNRHVAIGATQEKSVGFVDPIYGDVETEKEGEPTRMLARKTGDILAFSYKIEKKAVPGSIIKQELANRAIEFEKTSGYAPGKLWKRKEKEEILQTFLPKCFPSTSEIEGYLDLKNHLLVVGTANIGTAEEIASFFRRAFEKMEPRFIKVKLTTGELMSQWIRHEAPANFTVDMDGEMKKGNGGTIKFVSQSMTDKEVCGHLDTGYAVTKLAMTWNSEVSFVATREFVFTKLSFLAGRGDTTAEDRESEFAAQYLLEAELIGKLIFDMGDACGGMITEASSDESEVTHEAEEKVLEAA